VADPSALCDPTRSKRSVDVFRKTLNQLVLLCVSLMKVVGIVKLK